MRLLTDMHIHTVASGHAYSTVDENIRAASQKGLKLIALTDHSSGLPGGAHPFHFNNLRIIPRKMHDVIVVRGIEANIMDYEGNIDVPEEMLEELDFVIASLHPPCIDYADESLVTNTLVEAMKNPAIHVIGHPGDTRYPFDVEKVVKVAKETNTLLEVNNASLKPTSFRPGVRETLVEMLHYCKQYEVPIMVNTDAHICYDIGEFKESLELLKEVDFPEHLVINTSLERLLDIISLNELKSLI